MTTAGTTLAPIQTPRPAVRAAVSLLVALHLFAVFLGPWAMQPASDLAVESARIF